MIGINNLQRFGSVQIEPAWNLNRTEPNHEAVKPIKPRFRGLVSVFNLRQNSKFKIFIISKNKSQTQFIRSF